MSWNAVVTAAVLFATALILGPAATEWMRDGSYLLLGMLFLGLLAGVALTQMAGRAVREGRESRQQRGPR